MQAKLDLPALAMGLIHEVTPPDLLGATIDGLVVGLWSDAMDDPAIWVHPTDPSRSLVMANDKKGAFETYDLDDIANMSYRELASRFDLPETTVTNRLAAIRRQFRAIVLDVLRDATASDDEYRAEVRALLGVDV